MCVFFSWVFVCFGCCLLARVVGVCLRPSTHDSTLEHHHFCAAQLHRQKANLQDTFPRLCLCTAKLMSIQAQLRKKRRQKAERKAARQAAKERAKTAAVGQLFLNQNPNASTADEEALQAAIAAGAPVQTSAAAAAKTQKHHQPVASKQHMPKHQPMPKETFNGRRDINGAIRSKKGGDKQ